MSVAVLSLMLCGIGPGAAADASAHKPITHTVTIDGTSFQPASLTVHLGDTIVWVNKDPFPHTVTSKSAGVESGAIAPGKSWKFKPTRKGDVDYICSFHTTMKAHFQVQ